MKYLLFILLAALCGGQIQAQKLPKKPNKPSHVADFAQLLSAEERDFLQQQLQAYQEATNNQVVLAIVDSLSNANVKDYAAKLYQAWQLGTQTRDYAALLLVSKQARQIHIAAGQPLENAIPDALIFRILNQEMQPQFLKNQYFIGIEIGLGSIISAITPDYPVRRSPQLAQLQTQSQAQDSAQQRAAQNYTDQQAATNKIASFQSLILQSILHLVACLLLYIVVIFASFKIWSPAPWRDTQHAVYQSKWIKRTAINAAIFLLSPLIFDYLTGLPPAISRVGFAAILMADSYMFNKRLAAEAKFKKAYQNLYIYQSLLLASLLFLWFAPQQRPHINALIALLILVFWRSAYLKPSSQTSKNTPKSKTYTSNTPKSSYTHYRDYSNNNSYSDYSDTYSDYSDYSDSSYGGGTTGGGGASGSW